MTAMAEIYFIGGASCSGKTTLANELAGKDQMRYFGADDRLGEFAEDAISRKCPVAQKHSQMTLEAFFMRDPEEQAEELIQFYHEIFPAVMKALKEQLSENESIIAEGCCFLPELMKQEGIDPAHYRCLTADTAFQRAHYRERDWVPLFLAECRDPERAFELWMQREAIFAEKVREQAERAGYEATAYDRTDSAAERKGTT